MRRGLLTNEEIAHFTTGDFMEYFQNNFDLDLQQTQTTTGAGVVNFSTGLATQSTQRSSSTRTIVSDQTVYQISRGISVFASGGHEDIVYSGANAGAGLPSIHDLTWALGTTLTPNTDGALTVSYGHQNGFNSVTVDGHYAVTPRTSLTASYGSTLGTQLENVQNQLNLAAASPNGALVNAQTGGPLFGGTNALAVQRGVFRTDTLTLQSQTVLDRDIISFALLLDQADAIRLVQRIDYQQEVRQHELAAPDATRHVTISGINRLCDPGSDHWSGFRCQSGQQHLHRGQSGVAMADFRYIEC